MDESKLHSLIAKSQALLKQSEERLARADALLRGVLPKPALPGPDATESLVTSDNRSAIFQQ